MAHGQTNPNPICTHHLMGQTYSLHHLMPPTIQYVTKSNEWAWSQKGQKVVGTDKDVYMAKWMARQQMIHFLIPTRLFADFLMEINSIEKLYLGSIMSFDRRYGNLIFLLFVSKPLFPLLSYQLGKSPSFPH